MQQKQVQMKRRKRKAEPLAAAFTSAQSRHARELIARTQRLIVAIYGYAGK